MHAEGIAALVHRSAQFERFVEAARKLGVNESMKDFQVNDNFTTLSGVAEGSSGAGAPVPSVPWLDELRDATARALDILKAACPTALPSTPTGRIEAMRQRLDAMLQAVRTVRPVVEKFYQSLNDEQKARFNALGPNDGPDQQQVQRNLTQVCSERASGIASLPLERIERAVQPDGAQRSALKELQDATSEAVNLLSSDCPTYRALTPVGRLQAMEQRLDAMLRAVQTVQPALEKFYGSLGDEQKERFNRLSPAQG
jgi:hypothetical protein